MDSYQLSKADTIPNKATALKSTQNLKTLTTLTSQSIQAKQVIKTQFQMATMKKTPIQSKEMISKSQSPHTSQAQKQLHYQQASQLFNPNAYGNTQQQSYLSSAQQSKDQVVSNQKQVVTQKQQFGYAAGDQAGVMKGLQQAPSMPYLAQKSVYDAYSLSSQVASRNMGHVNINSAQRQQPLQQSAIMSNVASKDQFRKQNKILGVFNNYGGALSNNTGEGQLSQTSDLNKKQSTNRISSNKGSVNSNASNNSNQKRKIGDQNSQNQNRKKSNNSNQSQASSHQIQNQINDNMYYPFVNNNLQFQNQNKRSVGNSHDSKQSNHSKASANALASLQSSKGAKKLFKTQTQSHKKIQLNQSPNQEISQISSHPFNNDYGMADNIGVIKGPGSNIHHFNDKSKFAAYQTKIQVSNLKSQNDHSNTANNLNRKTPKFIASSNMTLHNQASFGQKQPKQYSNKTRNNLVGQNRTLQTANISNNDLQSPRFRQQLYFKGSSGSNRVKSNKHSQEARISALTDSKQESILQTSEPESEKQHKLRMKKKLLMSDSLQMLTKQRNQYLHHSINKSIQSKNNSQKSNQSREPRLMGGQASITCVVPNDEQNDAIYSAINDHQIQTITMHNSQNSSNNFQETNQSQQHSSITGSFKQPTQNSEYHHHNISMGSRKELSFRYKEADYRIEHVHSGEYTEPELISGLGADECISSRRQTKHSPSFPQSIVTSANAGQTIVHSLNSQDNMSSTGTLIKNTSGGTPAITSVSGSRIAVQSKSSHNIPSNNGVQQTQMRKQLQQKAINVKKAMVRVSQGFKEKFPIVNQNQSNNVSSTNAPIINENKKSVPLKQVIDKADFAQKLQKVQDDIMLRNQIQDQREFELNKLQQDFQDQVTDANKNSAQQSIMESSSRELTFQLRELERLQQQSQFEIEIPQPANSIKQPVNEHLKLNFKLNSHRDVSDRNLGHQFGDMVLAKSQSSSRFQNLQINPNSDRHIHRQAELQKQKHFLSQNLMQTEQIQQMPSDLIDENLIMQEGVSGEVSDPVIQMLKPHADQIARFEEIEEGCTGHDSRRAQLKLNHTPQTNNNFNSQIETSEQNYGPEISQSSQMTPTVGQFQQSTSSNQKGIVTQKQGNVPHNIKMRPLNLNQFQHSHTVANEKYRKQLNFHAQLSSSRLSLKDQINGAKMSERDAETERKGIIPSSRSSLMASQNIQQINQRSKLDKILNVKVTRKVEDRKSKQLTDSDTGGLKTQTNNSLNNEGSIQFANQNHQNNNQIASYGSGSKRGLNSRNMNYSDLKSPPHSSLSQNKFAQSNQKYDEQIYMTIGQADPHPSQQTQIEMSASHLEQSNTSNINSSQTSNHPNSNHFYSVDQKGQKKKFSTIDNEVQHQKKLQVNTMAQNSRVQKKIRINELPTSPRNKGLPQINSAMRISNNGTNLYPSTVQDNKIHVQKQSHLAQQNDSINNINQIERKMNLSFENKSQNQKLRKLQESRSLETNERLMTFTDQHIQVQQSENQIPSTTACDLNSLDQTTQKLKQSKKGVQSTLEFQLTGKGQYKLVKVKNRSQDPFSRNQELKNGNCQDYNLNGVQHQNIIGHEQQKMLIYQSPGQQNEMQINQSSSQATAQYNSRRAAGMPNSSKNFKVMVVRSSDGQRKQIGMGAPIQSKFGQAPTNQHLNDYANLDQNVIPPRSSSIHMSYKLDEQKRAMMMKQQSQKQMVINNESSNGSQLSENYANVGQAGKRANSTQSDQLKRTKINASQLFDNSFLCCLTQTKQKKDSTLRQFR